MLENILQTRCMGLVFIVLPMGIGMKGHGMREEDRGLECTHLEMGKPNLVTGKMEFWMFQVHRTPLILYVLLVFIIPKYLMQCRYLTFYGSKFFFFQVKFYSMFLLVLGHTLLATIVNLNFWKCYCHCNEYLSQRLSSVLRLHFLLAF